MKENKFLPLWAVITLLVFVVLCLPIGIAMIAVPAYVVENYNETAWLLVGIIGCIAILIVALLVFIWIYPSLAHQLYLNTLHKYESEDLAVMGIVPEDFMKRLENEGFGIDEHDNMTKHLNSTQHKGSVIIKAIFTPMKPGESAYLAPRTNREKDGGMVPALWIDWIFFTLKTTSDEDRKAVMDASIRQMTESSLSEGKQVTEYFIIDKDKKQLFYFNPKYNEKQNSPYLKSHQYFKNIMKIK